MENNTVICNYCHTEVENKGMFCPNCGMPLQQQAENGTTVLGEQPYDETTGINTLNSTEATIVLNDEGSNATTVLNNNFHTNDQQGKSTYQAAQAPVSFAPKVPPVSAVQNQFRPVEDRQGQNVNYTGNPANAQGGNNMLNNVGVNGQQSAYQPSLNQYNNINKKSGMTWWKILLICIGGFFALILIASIIIVATQSTKSSNSSVNSGGFAVTSGVTNNNAAYTKGSIQDGWYINEWADIKFQVTDDWPNGSEYAYSKFSDEKTECGFVSVDELTGEQFYLFFEDLNNLYSSVTYDETKYMDLCVSQLKEGYDEANANGSVKVELGTRSTTQIAGNNYLVQPINFYSKEGIKSNFCQKVYVKIIQNRAVVIAITGPEDKIDATIASITNAK